MNADCKHLRTRFLELLDDWGGFLQTNLYREALAHFFGGFEVASQKIPIYDGGIDVRAHEVCLIAEGAVLALTALRQRKDAMREHLDRFLKHTQLKCVRWINLDNHDIEFQTISA